MGAVEDVPGPMPPTCKRDQVGTQWLAVVVFNEPVGMLCEDVRLLFRYKWRHPDCRFEVTLANLFEHSLNVPPEGRSRLKPIAHRRLVTIVDLNIPKTRRVLGDEV